MMNARAAALAAGTALALCGPAAAQTFFADVSDSVFAAGSTHFYSRSVAWGDYDNDGWADLFLAENGGPRLALWGNEGEALLRRARRCHRWRVFAGALRRRGGVRRLRPGRRPGCPCAGGRVPLGVPPTQPAAAQ
ncbi:MAG: VCBS repeat-containing protein [Candidatus Latescibacterota bacterium]